MVPIIISLVPRLAPVNSIKPTVFEASVIKVSLIVVAFRRFVWVITESTLFPFLLRFEPQSKTSPLDPEVKSVI